MNNAPIGIFDSGLGGLTVARGIADVLPSESFIYVGDQARCPYGPRDASEVQDFVRQIGTFLANNQVKLIVIACNTATACALSVAQQHFDVPVIGVIDAGARAVLDVTQTGKIAVIGTPLTIESNAYPEAIAVRDNQAEVFAGAAPELAGIVESGREDEAAIDVQEHGEYYQLVESYLQPLLGADREREVDTLLLGCTHYPVLLQALQVVAGCEVALVCAVREVADEVRQVLEDARQLANLQNVPEHIFYTTAEDTETFRRLGSKIFGSDLVNVEHLCLDEG